MSTMHARGADLPVMGDVLTDEDISGLHADGWCGEELRFSVRAERPVRTLSLRLLIPEHVPTQTRLYAEVNGARCIDVFSGPGMREFSGDLCLNQGESAFVRIGVSATINYKRLGVSLDERDLGFFLHALTFGRQSSEEQPPTEHVTTQAYGRWRMPEQPTLYTVIGDCHAQSFDGLLLESSEHPERRIVVKARWQPFTYARDFFRDGKLNEEVTRTLVELHLLRECDENADTPFPPLTMRPLYETPVRKYYRLRRGRENAVLLFSYGEVDSLDLAHALFGTARFALTPPLPWQNLLTDDEGNVPAISLAEARERVRTYCAPLFDGLLALRRHGYKNVFLLSLPPPRPIVHKPLPPIALRHKCSALFNRMYEEFCRENGIGFIPTWDEFMTDGKRKPRYDKDGLHLNAAAAAFSIARLQERLENAD